MPSLQVPPDAMRPARGRRMPTRSVMDDVTFCAWVAQATPGETLVYHRGFLGVDTGPAISTLQEGERRKLATLASAAFRAFEQGLVHLVQARLDVDRFAYIAVARPKPQAAADSLSRLLLAEPQSA